MPWPVKSHPGVALHPWPVFLGGKFAPCRAALAARLSRCMQLARPGKDRRCQLAPRCNTSFSDQFAFSRVQPAIRLWSLAGRLVLGAFGVLPGGS